MWLHLLTCIEYPLNTHLLTLKLFFFYFLLGAKDSQMGGIIFIFQMLTVGSGSISLCLAMMSTQEKNKLWFLPSGTTLNREEHSPQVRSVLRGQQCLCHLHSCNPSTSLQPSTDWDPCMITEGLEASLPLNSELPSSVWCLLEDVQI